MRAKEVVEIIPTKEVFVGDPKAPITLMEYGDYESEACAKVNEVVEKLLKQFPVPGCGARRKVLGDAFDAVCPSAAAWGDQFAGICKGLWGREQEVP
jgi:protein-disulfide isomerase